MPPLTACDGGCVSPPPLLPFGKQGYLAKQEYLAIYYWIVCHLLLDILPFILYVFCREQMLQLSIEKPGNRKNIRDSRALLLGRFKRLPAGVLFPHAAGQAVRT